MKKLLQYLKEKGLTLGSVESMTGGMFASAFTSVGGSSQVFKGSIVSYSVEIKNKVVGVSFETVKKFGVVSKEVAAEMAKNGLQVLNVDVCVSVTGNAGPTTEPGGKPVGCFYVGVATKNGVFVECFQKVGSRNKVRNKAVLAMRDFVYSKTI